MTTAGPLPLKFQIGARTVLRIQRTMQRVPLSLDDVLSGRLPTLPPLDRTAHGYAVTSLPVELEEAMTRASGEMLPFVRQRYTRYYADLGIGFDAWWGTLSANTRSGLKRKMKRIAQSSGGRIDVRSFKGPHEIEGFHEVARRIALRTYQERLMGAGLPASADFVSRMIAGAAANQVRAWLLYIGGEPAAYLYCPIRSGTVIYEYVGHDPAFSELSPGAVLQVEAMRELFAEGSFTHFDFTEGEGQHKRAMATGGVPCIDMLLLRPSIANRATMTALGGFDRSVALGKSLVARAGLQDMAKRLRRG
jgi:hypothetical protein